MTVFSFAYLASSTVFYIKNKHSSDLSLSIVLFFAGANIKEFYTKVDGVTDIPFYAYLSYLSTFLGNSNLKR